MGNFFQDIVNYDEFNSCLNSLVRISIGIVLIGIGIICGLEKTEKFHKVLIIIRYTLSKIILIASTFLSLSMKFVEDKTLKNLLLFTSSLGLCYRPDCKKICLENIKNIQEKKEWMCDFVSVVSWVMTIVSVVILFINIYVDSSKHSFYQILFNLVITIKIVNVEDLLSPITNKLFGSKQHNSPNSNRLVLNGNKVGLNQRSQQQVQQLSEVDELQEKLNQILLYCKCILEFCSISQPILKNWIIVKDGELFSTDNIQVILEVMIVDNNCYLIKKKILTNNEFNNQLQSNDRSSSLDYSHNATEDETMEAIASDLMNQILNPRVKTE